MQNITSKLLLYNSLTLNNTTMKKLICLLLLMPFLFLSCNKDEPIPKPTAEFTYTMGANGYITFNNVSTNSDSYKWDFGDNGTTTEKSPFYLYRENKTFQVSLTATGAGGSDVIVKSVEVTNIKGNLIVYKASSIGNQDAINVWVDDVYKGYINGMYYYTSSPSCGNSNSVNVTDLSPGIHSLRCQDYRGTKNWSTTVNIIGGKCNAMGLN